METDLDGDDHVGGLVTDDALCRSNPVPVKICSLRTSTARRVSSWLALSLISSASAMTSSPCSAMSWVRPGQAARATATPVLPSELALHAIHSGRERGLTVVLDPAPAVPLPDEIWSFIDIVTPNETEATLLTGIEVTNEASAEAAARWFLDRGARAAIITMAAAGALLVTADGARRFAPFLVDAVDTTAAGDAFAGYLGAALAEGAELDQAIRRASAAGAQTVTARGASPSLPSRAQVDRFLAEYEATKTSTIRREA
jgi:ribokinase